MARCRSLPADGKKNAAGGGAADGSMTRKDGNALRRDWSGPPYFTTPIIIDAGNSFSR
jgi:hypothetical protein